MVLFVVCLCVYGWGPIGDQYLVRRFARPAFACIELGLACPPSDTALTALLVRVLSLKEGSEHTSVNRNHQLGLALPNSDSTTWLEIAEGLKFLLL